MSSIIHRDSENSDPNQKAASSTIPTKRRTMGNPSTTSNQINNAGKSVKINNCN